MSTTTTDKPKRRAGMPSRLRAARDSVTAAEGKAEEARHRRDVLVIEALAEGRTGQAIADDAGVTKQRVSQIKREVLAWAEAVKKLTGKG